MESDSFDNECCPIFFYLNMKHYLAIALIGFCCLNICAQLEPQFTHYSVDDGLSENHVLCIHQDKKGMIWMGTYFGLNKFDGYKFSNYCGTLQQPFRLSNYRINRIKEDRQGFLWVQTNDNRFYRFDPATENFLPVPQCLKGYENYARSLNRITVLEDGSVWLFSSEKENSDCFRIENSKDNNSIQLLALPSPKKNGEGRIIHTIYQDRNQNNWVLSTEGAIRIRPQEKRRTIETKPLVESNCWSIYEGTNSIYLGGEKGKLIQFDKKSEKINVLQSSSHGNLIDIAPLNGANLLLLTNQSDLLIYHPDNNQFTQEIWPSRPTIGYGFYNDRFGNIWIDSNKKGGIYLKPKSGNVTFIEVDTTGYVSQQATKFYAFEDIHRQLWIQLRSGGLFQYNDQLQKLVGIKSPSHNNVSFSNMVHTAIADDEGNLWLSTYLQGLYKLVFRQSPFTFTQPEPSRGAMMQNEVRAIFQDKDQRIWVGTKKGRVYLYDNHRKLIGNIDANGKLNGRKEFTYPPYDIKQDRKGNIWLATKGDGLYCLKTRDKTHFAMSHYRHDPNDPYSLSSDAVYSIFEDKASRIWIGTYGGGVNLIEDKQGKIGFIHRGNQLKNYPTPEGEKVRYLTSDAKGNILVGTTQGLIAFRPNVAPQKIQFTRYTHNSEDQHSITGNDIQHLLSARNGDLYIALIGGGVDVVKGGLQLERQNHFEALPNDDGHLAASSYYTLIEDKHSDIWISGQTHILRYHPSKRRTESYKPVSNNPYFFCEAAACRTHLGEILYGTSNGWITFRPENLNKSKYTPRISFTQLLLFNKEVEIGGDDSPLKQTIDYTAHLELSHNQHTLSIEYAAIDHTNPTAIQYAYRLDGLDKEWNYVGNQRIATYINLPKGKYTFRVKSTNADGQWVDNERNFVIEKHPSFWESVWGYIFYFALIILFTGFVAYVWTLIYKLRNEVELEQRVSDMKLSFFTDISHELRTPLTLIASPIDHILNKEELSHTLRQQLKVVQTNTHRMVRLINQILDFRKIQSHKMSLHIVSLEVESFIRDNCYHFSKLAEERSIAIQIKRETEQPVWLWLDSEKFEQILFNLISNAFKYSHELSKIDILIKEEEESIIIAIQDFGKGIEQDKLLKIFERFESFVSSKSNALQASSGIGLSLTRELVELHKGTISVVSEVGKGTTFILHFKKGYSHFSHTERVEIDTNTREEVPYPMESKESTTEESAEERSHLLIVEDNEELRRFLVSVLRERYEVSEAANGREALEIALNRQPDIVITDLMMPDMDGMELATLIKEDMNISHIPIVLLTAKTDIESKLEALKNGVDDYITKPFNLVYLEARIDNLLKQRRHLQSYFQNMFEPNARISSPPTINKQDGLFVEKCLRYIEEHYIESKMNIDDIAANVGMSRSSFYKKLKAITGIAPVDFIRDYRLQKAYKIMEEGETNISQVAFAIGIEDPRYFSKCFKMKYGKKPSEFKKTFQQKGDSR